MPRACFRKSLVRDRCAECAFHTARCVVEKKTMTSRWRLKTIASAGIADLDGRRIDVVSQGEWIDAGAPIEVIRVEGNRIVVRQRRAPQERGPG